jgi:chromosome segregation ATPase
MVSDQITKRLQWIEEERRKDKDTLALLESRMTTFEGNIKSLGEQMKEIGGELNRLSAVVTRMDQHDASMTQLRIDTKRQLDELDRETKKREDEAEKVRRVETKALDTNVQELRRDFEALDKLERNLQARTEEDIRLSRALEDVRQQVEGLRREEEEYTRTYRLLEDGRRQDAKRLADIVNEVATLRKLADSQRGQLEVLSTSVHKAETRMNELSTVEMERRDAVTQFLDKQALAQAERDRLWRDWQARFETIEKQATDIESQLVALDTTHRETKRAQAVLEELNQRVERRISEITEVQRLSEDRFRQEWVTFKADDQKRWTNYTLSQEEQRGELRRQFTHITEQVTQLEDSLQETRDLLQQVNELSEKQLQTLLSDVHDWVSNFERTVGRTRQT